MWCLLVILLLWTYIISVSCECKYIRKDGKGYELDTCSFSSTLSGNNISWGFYCQQINSTEDYIAVYKQWDAINCPDTITPSNTFYQSDCNDDDDDCDCIGGTEEDKCSIARLRIEACENNGDEIYQETKYTINICEITGEQTSKQTVCDNGNNLMTMSYENNECGGYGFKINDGEGYNLNDDEICARVICQSAVSQYSFIYGFGAIYAIIIAIKLI